MIKSGLVIYAAQLDLLTRFYQQTFELDLRESDHSYAALESKAFELVILTTETAQSNVLAKTAKPRVSTAMKPVFFISESLEFMRNKISEHHGVLNGKDSEWAFNDLTVCDGRDPEGNIFQLRTTAL